MKKPARTWVGTTFGPALGRWEREGCPPISTTLRAGSVR